MNGEVEAVPCRIVFERFVVDTVIYIQLGNSLTGTSGNNVDVAQNIWNWKSADVGNVISGDVEGFGGIAVRNVNFNVQVGNVFDPGVVGVTD